MYLQPPGQLIVSIETVPPSEPFPAAIFIGLRCNVEGGEGNITFNWTVICSSHKPHINVTSYNNRTAVGEIDLHFRSTPRACQDTVICTAIDHTSGITGFAVWRIGNISG